MYFQLAPRTILQQGVAQYDTPAGWMPPISHWETLQLITEASPIWDENLIHDEIEFGEGY